MKYLESLLLSLVLIVNVSSFYIIPLRAGTIQITDSDIRSTKLLKKSIDLKLSKQTYESHFDTTVIASISSLSMDDKLNFYFEYHIVCPEQNCFLNFTLVRKTQNVNPEFIYSVDVDYLVARGLKILELNMTSYQEHLNLRNIKSYNQKNQKEDLGKFKPKNNGDAMRIMAIPNGFSNLTRTGRVVYLYPMNEDMYVVHYMEHENGHSQLDKMGWPEGRDYIKYKVLFFDYTYLPAGCKTDDQWKLTQSYELQCGEKDQTKWFFGFKSTKEKSIVGKLKQNSAGYSFSLNADTARYGVLGFPFTNTPQFIDQRLTKFEQSGNSSSIILIALTTLFIAVILLLVRKCHIFSFPPQKQNFNELQGRSETFNSQREQKKSIDNNLQVKNEITS